MSGSHNRTSKWDPKEMPHHLPGEHGVHGLGRPDNRESQASWHFGDENYNDLGEPLDATMMFDDETIMSPGLDSWMRERRNPSSEISQGRSCRTIRRSRSRSPERGFYRAGFNDRSTGDQHYKEDIAAGRSPRGLGSKYSWESSNVKNGDFRYFNRDVISHPRVKDSSDVTSLPHQINIIPCKFFAIGNCHKGKLCRFSHQCDTHERVLGKRAIGSSLHDNPASVSRSMVHQMDGDEARKNSKRDSIMLTSYSTESGMGVSEPRGDAVQRVEGLNHSTRPLKSLFQEEGASQSSTMVNRPIFGLKAVQKGQDEAFISNDNPGPSLLHNDCDLKTKLSTQDGTSSEADVMDRVRAGEIQLTHTASTEPFSNFMSALVQLLSNGLQQFGAATPWNTLGFMQASVPSSAAPYTVCPSVSRQLHLDSSQTKVSINEKAEVPLELPLAGEPSGAGEGQDSVVLKNNEGDGKVDEKKKNGDEKNLRDFKFALAEFVKNLLEPTWKKGQLDKEVYKMIVKKVVQKVTAGIQVVHIQSPAKIESYLSSSKPKLSKLVQAYVSMYRK